VYDNRILVVHSKKLINPGSLLDEEPLRVERVQEVQKVVDFGPAGGGHLFQLVEAE
jgi:hypothetical protein